MPNITIRLRSCLMVIGLLAGAGCAPSANSPSREARLVIAEKQEPNSLNPLFMTGPAAAEIGPLVYSGLLTVDERGRLQPDVATTVPTQRNGGISPDGLSITYHLKPRASWQDGVPLTAADVVFTYAAVVNPANNIPSRFGYDEIRSVEALDAHTVRVHLRRSYAPILSLFMAPDQNFEILPRHLLARYRDLNTVAFNEAPVGSGPFRVVKWLHGDRLQLARNDAYFGGKPHIAAIELRFVPDSAAILNQLRTREIDAAMFADPAFLAEYRRLSGYRVVRVRLSGFGDLLFNVQNPDVADPLVRRAVVSAIDIPRLVRNATKGAQSASDAGRGLYGWTYDPKFRPPGYDPRAAALLFDNAGWLRDAGGIRRESGRPLSLELALPSGSAATAAIGVDLQQELRAAGVSLTLRAYTPTEFRAPAASGGPLYGGRFALAFFEPFGSSDPDTHYYLGCSEFPPHGFNMQRFCDPIVDAAQAAGARSYDRATRLREAALVQRRVALAVPFVALYQTNAVDIIPANLTGFRSSSLSPLWNVARWELDAKPTAISSPRQPQ